jgi:hypothetical protein
MPEYISLPDSTPQRHAATIPGIKLLDLVHFRVYMKAKSNKYSIIILQLCVYHEVYASIHPTEHDRNPSLNTVDILCEPIKVRMLQKSYNTICPLVGTMYKSCDHCNGKQRRNIKKQHFKIKWIKVKHCLHEQHLLAINSALYMMTGWLSYQTQAQPITKQT